MRISRRRFLQTSGAALAMPAPSLRRVLGTNEDLRLAVVGVRSRGRDHIQGFHRLPGVRVVALCDVDGKILAQTAESFAKGELSRRQKDGALVAEPSAVATHTDFRRVLDDKSIDAVALATPNHLHALHTVWACEAQKDVYVEKPVSHNVWEGRQMVRAARKWGRIVQTGTQSRSSPSLEEAVAFVHGGALGPIRLVRGLCYKPRPSIGKVAAPTEVPAWIDYDLWCGPAPKLPLMRKSLHYDWHWVWPTGNGDLGNQGIHQMDIGRWFLGVDRLASRVLSFGGRIGYDDDGETPNTLVTCYDFGGPSMIFEVRGLRSGPPRKSAEGKLVDAPMDKFRGASIGVIVHCEGGHVTVPSYTSAIAYDADGKEVKRFQGGGDHYANFVAAVGSRRPKDLRADIEQGHLSSALCHLGNISLRRGQEADPDAIAAAVKGDGWAEETVQRMRDHLQRNEVDLGATPLTLGKALRFDPATERFVEDAAADALLARDYRAPFVVREIT